MRAALGVLLLVAGCATTTTSTTMVPAPGGPAQERRGRVESVQSTFNARQGNPGAGAVAGAVVGGMLGGLLTGRGAGAAIGALGGAMVGAGTSQGYSEVRTYDVSVRFDDGSVRVFTYRGYPPFQPGQPVTLTPRGLVAGGTFAVAPPRRGSLPSAAQGRAKGRATPPRRANGSARRRLLLPPSTIRLAGLRCPPELGLPPRSTAAVVDAFDAACTSTTHLGLRKRRSVHVVYYPAVGWTWVMRPGPGAWCTRRSYFRGEHGARFGWYGHGWGGRWSGERPLHYRGSRAARRRYHFGCR